MRKKKWFHLLVECILCVLLVAFDQWTKYYATIHLKNRVDIPIIRGVLELHYLENRGAAFGILQDQNLFFLLIGIVAVFVCAYLLWKVPVKKKYVWSILKEETKKLYQVGERIKVIEKYERYRNQKISVKKNATITAIYNGTLQIVYDDGKKDYVKILNPDPNKDYGIEPNAVSYLTVENLDVVEKITDTTEDIFCTKFI